MRRYHSWRLKPPKCQIFSVRAETHDKLDIPFGLEGERKHCDVCLGWRSAGWCGGATLVSLYSYDLGSLCVISMW